MPDDQTEVLVVGGSLVGLSTALFLRQHGVDVVLAERHPGTSIHPRTPGYNPRSVELFRAAGVEEAVRGAGPWRLTGTGMLWAESLTSPNHQWFQPPNSRGPRADFSDVSPCDFAVLSQDKLEPVLRESAERRGADLRFGTELASFTADGGGVTAVLADRATGARSTVRADYLVAADGTESSVRERLGLGGHDPVVLEHAVSVMVRADLRRALDGRWFVICQVDNPEVSGIVRVVGDMMALNIRYDPSRGEGPDQFTPQRCVELARAAIGDPDLAVEPVDVLPWRPMATVARRFSHGRVFLAGDAAHVMPPSGAYGANTGIQDAANLAWKLGYVLRGWADPALLDTYDTERRPVAEFTVAQALATARHWFGAELPAGVADVELRDDVAVMFGYRYPAHGPSEPAEDPLRPTAHPGGRLPHVWLYRDGGRVSTVDLWASGPVVLAGAEGGPWVRAAEVLAEHTGLSVGAYRVGAEPTSDDVPFLLDPQARWPEVTGIGDTGAVLVRPDGFVAWRADGLPDAPHAALDGALREMLGTPVPT